MDPNLPVVTGTTHLLPFERLSPSDFERLCFWLIRREGYTGAELIGASGNDRGRDITAWRGNNRVSFQCKRVREFGPSDLEVEIEKIKQLPAGAYPDEIVFIVTANVSDRTRSEARRLWGEGKCEFLALSELDEKVKRHLDIVREFFQIPDSISRKHALGSYFLALRDFCAQLTYLSLPGNLLPSLTTTYIPQQLEELGQSLKLSLDLALEQHRHIIIEGDAGIGKSSLLSQHTLKQILRVEAGESDVYPIRIQARTLATNPEGIWDDILRSSISRELAGRLPENLPPGFFLEGQWLLMVDGFDEVIDPVARLRVLKYLVFHALRSDPTYLLVLTARRGVLTNEALPGFKYYRLLPFDPRSVEDFAYRWFAGRTEDPHLDAVQLLSRIRDSRLVELTRIPLLLAMAAVLYERDRSRPLPTRRAGLYERFVRLLMEDEEVTRDTRSQFRSSWDARLGMEGRSWVDKLFNARRSLLENLAHLQISTGELSMIQESCRFLAHAGLFPSDINNEWLVEQVQLMLLRTGLVVDLGGEHAFRHASFRDYLAASAAAREFPPETQGALDTLSRLCERSEHREVALFICSAWSEKNLDLSRPLAHLTALADQGVILAGQVLLERPSVEESVAQMIVDLLIDLVPRMGSELKDVLIPPNPLSILERLRDFEHIPERLATLGGSDDIKPPIKMGIGFALRKLGDNESAARILQSLAGSASEVGLFCQHELKEIGASGELIQVLWDKNADNTMRMLAAQLAGEIGHGERVLAAAMDSRLDREGRKAAIAALGLLRRYNDLHELACDRKFGQALFFALAETLEKHGRVDVLTDIVRDSRAEIDARRAAGIALSRLKQLDVIKDLSRDPKVSREVALFLGVLAGGTDHAKLQQLVGSRMLPLSRQRGPSKPNKRGGRKKR